MLPSLYSVSDYDRAWSVPRAAGYGAAIGALAAAFKMFGMAPLTGAGGPIGGHVAGGAMQIALAALAFALLCAAAAALRNYLAQRFVRGDGL